MLHTFISHQSRGYARSFFFSTVLLRAAFLVSFATCVSLGPNRSPAEDSSSPRADVSSALSPRLRANDAFASPLGSSPRTRRKLTPPRRRASRRGSARATRAPASFAISSPLPRAASVLSPLHPGRVNVRAPVLPRVVSISAPPPKRSLASLLALASRSSRALTFAASAASAAAAAAAAAAAEAAEAAKVKALEERLAKAKREAKERFGGGAEMETTRGRTGARTFTRPG